MTNAMKELVKLLIEQSPADEIWSLYKELEMDDVCDYIEENYFISFDSNGCQ